MKPIKWQSPLSIYLEIGGIVVGTKTDLNVQTKQEISLQLQLKQRQQKPTFTKKLSKPFRRRFHFHKNKIFHRKCFRSKKNCYSEKLLKIKNVDSTLDYEPKHGTNKKTLTKKSKKNGKSNYQLIVIDQLC